ncbi:hypothetical protein SEA_BAILEYBLU_57 [Arthrobacter phage BaileyBlu]|uniref:Uncharacterized protein n=1 Tax=Arthrobacter phage BaileyBlu TaxID=2910754 RepID=A0AA49GZC4_9CAUD|nr:hypothetical protein PQD78_gp57 [Arthrobacter phage BaileyBlu]UJQ87195.1 hypothetical protein SEA_BAILEYBLU_57 [Arthrobacter phage BaileyBlu]
MNTLRAGLRRRWIALQALAAEAFTWYALNVVPPGDHGPASGSEPAEVVIVGPATYEAAYGSPEEVARL